MTDLELLEKAARAAGLYEQWPAPDYSVHVEDSGAWCSGMGEGLAWNPLTDDGDALRLAVKLEMQIDIISCQTRCLAFGGPTIYENESDTYAATRRAIVRAAAAIGETL